MNFPAQIRNTIDEIDQLSKKQPKLALNELRGFCEEFLEHLCFRFLIKEKHIQKQLSVLQQETDLNRIIADYIAHWYNVSSYGSHNQKDEIGDWDKHYKSCQDSMQWAMEWYLKEIPSYLQNKKKLKSYSKASLDSLSNMDSRFYVKPGNYNELSQKLEQSDMVFLLGDSWIGKTLTARELSKNLVEEEGYIPIVFLGETWQNKPMIIPMHLTKHTSGIRSDVSVFNEFLRSHTFYGYKFLVVFDDIYGHRSSIFNEYHSYESLVGLFPIRECIEANRSTSKFIGDIKFIVTSPSEVYDRSLEIIKRNEFYSQTIVQDNVKILDDSIQVLTKQHYLDKNFSDVVKNLAEYFNCQWFSEPTIIEFISESFEKESLSNFYALRRFIVDNKNTDSDLKVLGNLIEYLDEPIDYWENINKLDKQARKVILITYLYPFAKKTFALVGKGPQDFKDYISSFFLLNTKELKKLEEVTRNWIIWDADKGQSHPQLAHPDTAIQVEKYIENEREFFVQVIMDLVDRSDIFIAIHFLLRYGNYLDMDQFAILDDYFSRGKGRGFDPRNSVWALTNSLVYVIDNENTEKYLKRILRLYTFKSGYRDQKAEYLRVFIDHWFGLNEEHRELFLQSFAQQTKKRWLIERDNDYLSLVFYYLTKNYDALTVLSNKCNVTQALLGCYSDLIKMLKEDKKGSFETHVHDNVFNERVPGGVSGIELLERTISVAQSRGFISQNSNINRLI